MQLVILQVSTAIVILVAGSIMLRAVTKPLFVRHLCDAVPDDP